MQKLSFRKATENDVGSLCRYRQREEEGWKYGVLVKYDGQGLNSGWPFIVNIGDCRNVDETFGKSSPVEITTPARFCEVIVGPNWRFQASLVAFLAGEFTEGMFAELTNEDRVSLRGYIIDRIDEARRLWMWKREKEKTANKPKEDCTACEGTGEADTGAPTPWGEFITQPCECVQVGEDEGVPIYSEVESTSMVAALQDDIRQMKRDIETLSCWIRLTWDTSEFPGFERTAKVLDVCKKYEEK